MNSPVTGEFPAQKPVTRRFDVFFDVRLNKRLSKQWWGCWFEMPSCPLWRHCNAEYQKFTYFLECTVTPFLTQWHYIASKLTHHTVYPKKYAHSFVVLCFVVVMQSFIMNSHEVFIHIHQGCFAGTGAIVRLPQCQWSKPDGYGKISQCITTTKHSKAKTVCIFLGIYCILMQYSAIASTCSNPVAYGTEITLIPDAHHIVHMHCPGQYVCMLNPTSVGCA